MIKIENLTYNYDSKFSALYDVNLSIDKNTVLFSDELSSKSLFRILCKQYEDYKGEVIIDNKNLKEIKFKDTSISYITNPPYLLKNKSVTYNVAYPLIVRKEDKRQALQKATLLMNEYNLQENKIKNCTNFEKLMISLLRTLIRHPKIVLIDDIFINLNDEELDNVLNIINLILKDSLIIIALNNDKLIDRFKNFDVVKLYNGSLIN